MPNPNVRNVAIIAHVDHGKTTLVDKLLQQTGLLADHSMERVMDSNDLEKERGITILAKNTSINYEGTQINIVDTPGHADFGGEVERILSMVDAVILLVDAVDGPMPQTRFVTQKAFGFGLKPILVVNKIDRPGAEPYRVIDEVFELFDSLGGTDEQLDFSVVYASALQGTAGMEPDQQVDNMSPLLDLIVSEVPPPDVAEGPLQMQISSLDYSSYEGVIGIGRVSRGSVKRLQQVIAVDRQGVERKAKIQSVKGYRGLERVDQEQAHAGDIVCITGVADINISDTLCAPECIEPLPPLSVDEPTLSMMFCVNNSPLAGKEGKYLTSRQVRERLMTEALHNVALTVEETPDPDRFKVSGRGELHLSVLIETMRREGYEMAVSRPQVIFHEHEDGTIEEPYEDLSIDIEEQHQGKVMESLGERRGELKEMLPDGNGRVRMQFRIPTRGLMGYRPAFLSMTSGTGIMSFASAGFGPRLTDLVGQRTNGVLISNANGKAVAFGFV